MIAMALLNDPALLIADEPTTALDVTTQAQILTLIRELQHEHGTAVVLITHDLGVVAETADEIVVMYAARVAEQAPVFSLFEQPLHPYTWGLLGSLPRLDVELERLTQIGGQPPSLLRPPRGCRFRPRCAHAFDRCRGELPEATPASFDPGHLDACFLPEERKLELSRRVDRGARPRRGGGMTETLLEVEDVTKHFPITKGIFFKREVAAVKALDGVSLAVRRGETLGIVGESGCGKSTLARVIMRLLEPTSGTVRFDGADITHLSRERDAAVPARADDGLPGPVRVAQPAQARRARSSTEPLEVHGIGTDAERKRRVQELLEVVGLNPEHYNRFPHEFSGGQRQRIGVARALAVNPKLIVADEPVSALDVSVQAQILNLLKDLQTEFGLTYVFIAHDLSVVRHISDRVAVMYLGKLAELADSADLYAAPRHPYTGALLSAVPIANPRLGREPQHVRARRRRAEPDQPAERLPLPPALPARPGHVRGERPAARAAGARPRGRVLLPAREVAADRRRDADGGARRRVRHRRRPGSTARRRGAAPVIARGLRNLALVALGLAAATALGALLIGSAAGMSAQRAALRRLPARRVDRLHRRRARRHPRPGPRLPPGAPDAGRRLDGAARELVRGVPALGGARRPRPRARPARRPPPPDGRDLMARPALPVLGVECDAARERASLALDGALDDVGRRQLARHVARCAACAAVVDELGAVTALLRTAPLEAYRCELRPPARRAGRGRALGRQRGRRRRSRRGDRLAALRDRPRGADVAHGGGSRDDGAAGQAADRPAVGGRRLPRAAGRPRGVAPDRGG